MHWIENIQCDDKGAVMAMNTTNNENGYNESQKKNTIFAFTHKNYDEPNRSKNTERWHIHVPLKKKKTNWRSEYSVLKCVRWHKNEWKFFCANDEIFHHFDMSPKYDVHNDSVNTTHFIPDVFNHLPWHDSAGCSKEMRHANKHINDKCDFSIQWTHFHPISLHAIPKTHL